MLRSFSTPRNISREIYAAPIQHISQSDIASVDPVDRLTYIWSQLSADLTNRDEEVQTRAADFLRASVEKELAAVSMEERTRLLDDVTRHIFELVNSSDANDKLSGIRAMDELLRIRSDLQEVIIASFAGFSRLMFSGISATSESRVIEAAARTLGRLGRIGGTVTADSINFHIKQAFEWLAHSNSYSHAQPASNSQIEKNDKRQLAAVYTLKELSEQTPALLFLHAQQFFEYIWLALRDPRVEVREVASKAMNAALTDLQKRSSSTFQNICQKLLTEATGLLAGQSPHQVQPLSNYSSPPPSHHSHNSSVLHHPSSIPSSPMIAPRATSASSISPAPLAPSPSNPQQYSHSGSPSPPIKRPQGGSASSTHAALLVLHALLIHCPDLMSPHFLLLFGLVWKHRDSKDLHVLRSVLSLIPDLAALRIDAFLSSHCQSTMEFVLSQSDISSVLSDSAVLSLSRLVDLLGPAVVQYVDPILGNVTTLLQTSHIAVASQTSIPQHSGNSLLHKKRDRDREADRSKRLQRNIEACLECIGCIAFRLPQALTSFGSNRILDAVFSCPLSSPLVNVCKVLVTEVPLLSEECEERLSDLIITVLSRPFMPPVAAASGAHTGSLHVNTTNQSNQPQDHRHFHNSSLSNLASYASNSMASHMSHREHREQANNSPSPTHNATDSDSKKLGPYGLPRHMQLNKLTPPSQFSPVHLDIPVTLLAFRTLSEFPFHFATQYSLLAFSRFCLVLYCEDEHVRVRREACSAAVIIMCKMYDQFSATSPAASSITAHLLSVIGDVVRKLVTVAVSDPDASIRASMMDAFAHDSRIDKFLMQADMLSALFLALHDEITSIRESTIVLLGRLSSKNPAVILPTLRRVLLELLTELQAEPTAIHMLNNASSFNSQSEGHILSQQRGLNQEGSARLLGHLIGSCHILIKPYVDSILGVLVPKLDLALPNAVGLIGYDGQVVPSAYTPGLVSTVLSTLGQLSVICGEDMQPFLEHLLPILLDAIGGSVMPSGQFLSTSTAHKQIALRTLSLLMSSTSYVMDPYLKYPSLMPSILQILKQERDKGVRLEAMRLIGVIGALDPKLYRKTYQDYQQLIAVHRDQSRMPGAPFQSDGRLGPTARRGTSDSTRSLVLGSRSTFMRASDAHESKDPKDAGADGEAPYSSITAPPAAQLAGSLTHVNRAPRMLAANILALDEDEAQNNTLYLCQSGNYDEYFPQVALATLMKAVTDPRLTSYHSLTLSALMYILGKLGRERSVPFLASIVPVFINELHANDAADSSNGASTLIREAVMSRLASIIQLVGDAVKPWADAIIQSCLKLWPQTAVVTGISAPLAPMMIAANSIGAAAPLLHAILSCLDKIAVALPQHIQAYLSQFVQKALTHFAQTPNDVNTESTKRVLTTLTAVADAADLSCELHSLFPALLDLCEGEDSQGRTQNVDVRVKAVRLIGVIASRHDCSVQASRIFLPFARILASCTSPATQALFTDTLSVVCSLIPQMPFQFMVFEKLVSRSIQERERTDRHQSITSASTATTPNHATVQQRLGDRDRTFPDRQRDDRNFVERERELTQMLRYQRIITKLRARLIDLRDAQTGEIHPEDIIDERDRASSDFLAPVPHVREKEKRGKSQRKPPTSASTASGNSGKAPWLGSTGPGPLDRSFSGSDTSLAGRSSSSVTQNNFVPRVESSLTQYSMMAAASTLPIENVDEFVADSLQGSPATRVSSPSTYEPVPDIILSPSLDMKQANLQTAFNATVASTSEDWVNWLKTFQLELLHQSPSFALRACSALAMKHSGIARELTNAAFLSCWRELDDPLKDELVENFELILTTFITPNRQGQAIPHEIILTILAIAEFCQRHHQTLPINLERMAAAADRCHAYAHSLYYYEACFAAQPAKAISSLISVNNKLQLTEAAAGILAYAHAHECDGISPKWYEKLHQYEEALSGYEWHDLMDQSQSSALSTESSSFDSTLNQSMNASFIQPSSSSHDDEEVLLGRMRCLRELQQWERLAALASNTFVETGDERLRAAIAPLASSAMHHLRCWDMLDPYLNYLSESSFEGCFFRALYLIHCGSLSMASSMIDRAMESLDQGPGTVVGESYSRAYSSIIRLQQCAELHEIIVYQQSSEDRKQALKRMWSTRIASTQRTVGVWSELLSIRALVMTPKDDINCWLEYATLSRKSGKMSLSLKILTALLGFDPTALVVTQQSSNDIAQLAPLPKSFPQLTYSCLKHLYSAGHPRSAYNRLCELVASPTMQVNDGEERPDGLDRDRMDKLKSRCYLKLGDWQMDLIDGLSIHNYYDTDYSAHRRESSAGIELKSTITPKSVSSNAAYNSILPQVLNYFHAATVCDQSSFKAWHQWAMMNFTVVQRNKLSAHSTSGTTGTSHATSHAASHRNSMSVEGLPMPLPLIGGKRVSISGSADKRTFSRVDIHAHLVPAIHGFFRSLWLQKFDENSRQDVLRVLQLWFEYGYRRDVNEAMIAGINSISLDTWLAVIPQMIARMHTPHSQIRALLHELLAKIGKSHPQALVFALVVASKSHTEARRHSALHVLNTIKQHSPHLVAQAAMVSTELVRVAILWSEMWHEAIEEASRFWFGQKNLDGMISVLEPLHEMMELGPTTLNEQQFAQQFALELQQAWMYVQRAIMDPNKNKDALTKAWQIYSDVFQKVGKTMAFGDLATIELAQVSPRLLNAVDLELAVPGSYRVGEPCVRIAFFAPTLRVIESKQHPRRLTIAGSDGLSYAFLLKGHEDLRQDERVMQLFGLLNTLFASELSGSSPAIARYAVIPLSPNSGLIEWVPHCDTLHTVIKQYRDANQIVLNIEQQLMLNACADFASLSLPHKLEIFESALAVTSDTDLSEALWLKSRSMTSWLEHRGVFTRSLAVMSMVGYVLGLGDRHPSNLMIDRLSGQVIHIDFGDCFDVAQTREKFPERVPFRLTRMLRAAMECGGLGGTFLSTCQAALSTMRKNKNSVMALLEAFVYDPLINWRLLDGQQRFNAVDADVETEVESVPISPAAVHPSVHPGARDRRRSVIVAAKLDEAVDQGGSEDTEQLNERALAVIHSIHRKLRGTDFVIPGGEAMEVPAQVDGLIDQATSHLNLCQSYIGWCPFW